MGQLEPFLDFEHEFEDALDIRLIEHNHKTVEMLAKKGYKVRVPQWSHPIAS